MLLTTTKSRFNNSILIGVPQPDTDECVNGTLSFDENGVCTNELPEDVQILLAEVGTDLQYVKVEESDVTPPEPTIPPITPALPETPAVVAGVDPIVFNPSVDIVPIEPLIVGEPISATIVPATVEPIIPEIPVVKTIEEQKAETRASLEGLELDQLKDIAVQSGMNKNVVNKATKAGIVEYLVAKVQ